MWPFKHKKPPEDWYVTIERLERRIQKIEEEWTDVYGKFRRLQMRAAKQVQRAEELEESPAAGTAETVGETGGPISLTERQRQIQNQILERRRKIGVA